eukprot:CFRG6380T1
MNVPSVALSALALVALSVQLTSALSDVNVVSKQVASSTDDSRNDIYISGRIVGGAPVDERVPFMVSLNDPKYGYYAGHYCGGTLINKDWVMTAAHCLYGRIQLVYTHQVYIGMTSQTEADYLHKSGISKVVLHPEYNNDYLFNDIAMIRLSDPAPENSTVASLNEDPLEPQNGTLLWYLGWGLLSENSTTLPDELMTVGVQDVDIQKCQDVYGATLVSDKQVCTYTPGKDSCSGDSGGPLIQRGTDGSINSGVVVGIVSFGEGCAREGYPAVNTRVSSYTDWIKATMTDATANITCNVAACKPCWEGF